MRIQSYENDMDKERFWLTNLYKFSLFKCLETLIYEKKKEAVRTALHQVVCHGFKKNNICPVDLNFR